MSRVYVFFLCCAFVLICRVPLHAQVKDAFIQGVADFVNAANGMSGDEGPAMTAAIDAMARGLALWDAAVARVETGLASEIGGAPAPVAARMRATLGAVYLERGRLDAALEQFDAAVRVDPDVRDVQLLRGLVYERMNRVTNAQAALRVALQQEAGNVAAAYLLLRAVSKGADAGEKTAAMKTLSEAADAAPTASRPQFMVLDLIDDASVSAPVFVPAVYKDAAALLMQAKYGEAIATLRSRASSSLAAVRDERARLASADARGAVRRPRWCASRIGGGDTSLPRLGDVALEARTTSTAARR